MFSKQAKSKTKPDLAASEKTSLLILLLCFVYISAGVRFQKISSPLILTPENLTSDPVAIFSVHL